MLEDEFIEQLQRKKETQERGLALIREGEAKIAEGRALLEGQTTKAARRARAAGNGVTAEDARAYAEAVRRERPGVTPQELEALVTERARADGKSTKGLVARLRRVVRAED